LPIALNKTLMPARSENKTNFNVQNNEKIYSLQNIQKETETKLTKLDKTPHMDDGL
jgi:hypothetical protein